MQITDGARLNNLFKPVLSDQKKNIDSTLTFGKTRRTLDVRLLTDKRVNGSLK